MQLPLNSVADNGVAGVVAALKTDDGIGLLSEKVGDLSFSFVAPLGADYDYSWHLSDGVYAPRREYLVSAVVFSLQRKKTGVNVLESEPHSV